VLPREIFGKSTFEFAVMMLQWLPLWLVDKIILILAWFVLGNVEKLGLKRPATGPLELKNTKGKTPVLDLGALEKIRSGEIKVVPGVKRFNNGEAELVNGEKLDVDAVVLATGYRSNVPYWLQVRICSRSFLKLEKVFFSNIFITEDCQFRKAFGAVWFLSFLNFLLRGGLAVLEASFFINLIVNFCIHVEQ